MAVAGTLAGTFIGTRDELKSLLFEGTDSKSIFSFNVTGVKSAALPALRLAVDTLPPGIVELVETPGMDTVTITIRVPAKMMDRVVDALRGSPLGDEIVLAAERYLGNGVPPADAMPEPYAMISRVLTHGSLLTSRGVV